MAALPPAVLIILGSSEEITIKKDATVTVLGDDDTLENFGNPTIYDSTDQDGPVIEEGATFINRSIERVCNKLTNYFVYFFLAMCYYDYIKKTGLPVME